MNNEIYTILGYVVVWCIKYMFIPFGVAISSKLIVDKLLRPQPEGQRKKRSAKKPF